MPDLTIGGGVYRRCRHTHVAGIRRVTYEEFTPMFNDTIIRTDGIAPKVLLPFLALVLTGLVLVVVGFLIGDDTLRTLGYTVLGSALAGAAVGHQAPPAKTLPTVPATGQVDAPSDAGLSPEAIGKLPPPPAD